VANAPQAVAVRLARGEDTFLFVGELDRSMLEKMARSVPPRPNRVVSQRGDDRPETGSRQ
jgi:hypothetical protein